MSAELKAMERPLSEVELQRVHAWWRAAYAHLNRVIIARDLNVIPIIGPGHGGPALVANTWLEGSYSDLYPEVPRSAAGMQRLFNPRANGGLLLAELTLPPIADYAVKVDQPGKTTAESTRVLGKWLRDIFKSNARARNFRLFGPSSTSWTRCSTSMRSGWRRRAVASLNILLSSHVWRQDHNGFSHRERPPPHSTWSSVTSSIGSTSS